MIVFSDDRSGIACVCFGRGVASDEKSREKSEFIEEEVILRTGSSVNVSPNTGSCMPQLMNCK